MALAPISRWRIHIGAHKTATTHVQEVLALLRPGLVAQGVDFIPNRQLRAGGVAVALTRRHAAARIPLLRGRMVRRALAARLDPLRAGPATLVLSEEKLLGGSQHVFSDPIYPGLERTVGLLATLASRAEVTLFLSIRSFDTQLPSAYVQELKFMAPIGGGFDGIRHRVLARPPSWFDMVRRIRAAAPGIPLRVWRQEDYRDNPRAILSALCGVEVGPLPEIEDPPWTKSPDLAAIRAAEALPADMPLAERRVAVRAIFDASGDGERFRPFARAEREALQAAYAADLAKIAELDPDMLLRV
jgi:hypothetical protein